MLDNIALIREIDPSKAYNYIESLPQQIIESIYLSRRTLSSISIEGTPRSIIACGMGGSGIGLNIAKSIVEKELRIPLLIVRSYNLPTFVNERDLVFLCSYSGETEEVLYCFKEAVKRNAKVLTVSSGGSLEAFSQLINSVHVKIPKGLQPRMALGYLFPPLIVLLEKLNLIPSYIVDTLQKSSISLKSFARSLSIDVETEKNDAKKLALKIHDLLPLIYTYPPLSPIGLRFKQQLNENAKKYAVFQEFPELTHNEIESVNTLRIRKALVLLRLRNEPRYLKEKLEVSMGLIQNFVDETIEIFPKGESIISNLLHLLLLCDSVSLYVAYLRNMDPTSIPTITTMKQKLRSGSNFTEELRKEIETFI